MRPDLSDRTAMQIIVILAFELEVMQTELLGHGHVRSVEQCALVDHGRHDDG
jgi:hypothetical protein